MSADRGAIEATQVLSQAASKREPEPGATGGYRRRESDCDHFDLGQSFDPAPGFAALPFDAGARDLELAGVESDFLLTSRQVDRVGYLAPEAVAAARVDFDLQVDFSGTNAVREAIADSGAARLAGQRRGISSGLPAPAAGSECIRR